MAITRTPITDDDGSGTTGTILNNAWKQELYDQIDGSSAQSLIYGANGGLTGTGTVLLTSAVMPALGPRESLRIIVDYYQDQAPQAGAQLTLVAADNAVFLDLIGIGGGSLAAGAQGLWDVTLRPLVMSDTFVHVLAVGGLLNPNPFQGIKHTVSSFTTARWSVGGWTLGMLVSGQLAGNSQVWTMSVYRVIG